MDLLQAMKISATGLAAHRKKMVVIADNLANVETTRTPEGGPYQRKTVVLGARPAERFKDFLGRTRERDAGVEVEAVVASREDFRLVNNPNHPDADPDSGYVAMPNVNLLTEIADMMAARRAYDANITAISNTKNMIIKALEIGK